MDLLLLYKINLVPNTVKLNYEVKLLQAARYERKRYYFYHTMNDQHIQDSPKSFHRETIALAFFDKQFDIQGQVLDTNSRG